MDKKSVRSGLRQALAEIPGAVWSEASQESVSALVSWLSERPEIQKVSLFSAMPTEVDLGLAVSLMPSLEWHYPVVSGNEMVFHRVNEAATLRAGYRGILEPNPQVHPPVVADGMQLILCPGLAFTEKGERIGRGGGFYDRFLHSVPQALKMGVCLDAQVCEELPTEDHDVNMTHLLTGGRVIHLPKTCDE